MELEVSLQDEKPSTSEHAKLKMSKHTPAPTDATFKCQDCSLTTTSEDKLQLHCQREHSHSQHICILCSKSFATAQELGRHSRVCKPTTIVGPEEVKQASQLSETITEQGEKIWPCDLCEFK